MGKNENAEINSTEKEINFMDLLAGALDRYLQVEEVNKAVESDNEEGTVSLEFSPVQLVNKKIKFTVQVEDLVTGEVSEKSKVRLKVNDGDVDVKVDTKSTGQTEAEVIQIVVTNLFLQSFMSVFEAE